jgi:hypothetical protein
MNVKSAVQRYLFAVTREIAPIRSPQIDERWSRLLRVLTTSIQMLGYLFREENYGATGTKRRCDPDSGLR